MTNVRSAVVNNTRLACIAAAHRQSSPLPPHSLPLPPPNQTVRLIKTAEVHVWAELTVRVLDVCKLSWTLNARRQRKNRPAISKISCVTRSQHHCRCHQALRFASKDLLHDMTVFVRLFETTLEVCSASGAQEAERWALHNALSFWKFQTQSMESAFSHLVSFLEMRIEAQAVSHHLARKQSKQGKLINNHKPKAAPEILDRNWATPSFDPCFSKSLQY